MGRVPPLTPEEREALDKVARYRPTACGIVICDPSLDEAIKELHPDALARIRRGGSLSYEQAQALAAGDRENVCDSGFDGEEISPPEPEQ